MANYVKFVRGTPEAFAKLETKSKDTLYFISRDEDTKGLLYLGSKLISGDGGEGSSAEISLSQLKDVFISQELTEKSLLIYDGENWVNTDFEDLIFVGAQDNYPGVAGLVPAPKEGQTDLFLRSDGEWAAVESKDNKIITIENTNSENKHSDLIANEVINNPAVKGDIIIIKDLVIEDKWEYTAYVFDGEHWCAMDGNYNAENVFFDEDLVVTTKIGTIQTLTNGQAKLAAKGKNIKQVLSSLLAARQLPKATLPSASIKLTNDQFKYEVGTTVTPRWETKFSVGSYSYGPATGVTDNGGVVTSTKDTEGTTIAAGSLNISSGAFDSYQVEDNTKYYGYLSYGWNAGTSNPVDNFGEEYVNISSNLPIQAATGKTATSSDYIYGYRKWFKGGLESDSSTPLTSSLIREELDNSDSAISAQTFDLKAADYAGCKRVVIAIPSAANVGITEVLLKSSSNLTITSEFVLQNSTVEVEGAEGYTAKPYKIWIYEPAELDSSEVYTITIG